MQFSINRRLFKHKCVLFIGLFFICELIYLTFFTTHQSDVLDKQDSATVIVHIDDIDRQFLVHIQPFHYQVSCPSLLEGDPDELKHARALLSNFKSLPLIADSQYNWTSEQCTIYRSKRFNESFHVEDTSVNRQFPLAFTILMHENVEQFERLLRVIYRPQNYYCIHVDSDASSHVLVGVKSIVQCFNNVFLSSKREKVLYATFSRLQADLNCMQDLIKYPSWKYLLNVANTELPLKTNSELVKILSIYRGYNDIEGRWKSKNTGRTEYVWKIVNATDNTTLGHLRKTNEKKKSPPGNVEIVKGSAYGAFSRAFVKFIHSSPIAQELLNWSQDTFSPDEHFWATLNYNTHLRAPGGYKAKTDPTLWTARFVIWGQKHCSGRLLHGICLFGTADLPILSNRIELFANKFRLNYDPIVYQCLEELIINRSKLELPLNNANYYRQMPFLLPV